MLRFFSKLFFSYKFIILMLTLLALGAGIATFIENDYDAQTAKVLVYNAFWYEVVMVFLWISLFGIIVKTKMYKKMGSFLFHVGFLFVLLGASITRYYGYEGVIHIREGQSENIMISEESFFQIKSKNEDISHALSLSKMGNNHFSYKEMINNKPLLVEFKEYKFTKKSNVEKLIVSVNYNNTHQDVEILGGHGSVEVPTTLDYNGFEIDLSWGSKIIKLPFNIRLDDFQIKRYPGSQSPSSYLSKVEIIDDNKDFKYDIFMNHPLSYKGYKFFQSSYDRDEKGTVLSVNNDPGKWVTYFAYFLLCLGFVLNFFTKRSRFERLRVFLNENKMSFLVPLILMSNIYLNANENMEYINSFNKNTQEHAKSFGELYTQDYNGRIKPMSTESLDVLHKMSSKDSMYGLTATQIMLGILADPKYWENVKLIRIKNNELKKILGVDKSEKFIAFSKVFDENGQYIFNEQINMANEKKPSKRNTFDKDLIKLDERLNIFYLTTMGMFTKIIPNPNDLTHKWYDPQNVMMESWLDYEIKDALYMYHSGINKGITENDWAQANEALAILKKNQKQVSSKIIPTLTQTKIELLLNDLKIFPNLIIFYFLVGSMMLVSAIISIFFGKNSLLIKDLFFGLLLLGFLIHTFGISMRWYVSGHAPWSDTYESLIYVGWSTVFAGLVIFRKSLLALCAAAILGAIIMMVANLNFINPQITPLVPVLKSYWLSIHVSIITASYGFLGLGAVLSFLALLLMILKNQNNKERINQQIRQLSAITEISLIIGLSMLTIGNFLGGVWANESWGRYWGWDPKETWTLVSIVVYTITLHLRFMPKLNSIYIFLVASLISFTSILMTYFGVNFYLSGMHSYASGDKVSLPDFIYYVIDVILVVILFSFFKRDVKVIK